MTSEQDKAQISELRTVAIVIVSITLFWNVAQWAGRKLGIHGNFAFLFDMIALLGFIWVLFTVIRIWRKRHKE